jgi:sigma-E factor negative regulatory protein RseA
MQEDQNLTTTDQAVAERVSAWIDGSLSSQEASDLYRTVSSDPSLQAKWHEWHLIGDVMRSASLAKSAGVADRVAELLAKEPIHFLPATAGREKRQAMLSRRRVTYGLATAAAVAFVSVVAIAPQTQQGFSPAMLASSPPAVPIQPSQLEDPRLRDLLDTHGSMAIRPVSFELRDAKP